MAEKKTEELAKTGATAMGVRPAFISKTDRTGTEEIGLNEIRLPRLAIAQGLSFQMIPDDSRYIDGLKLFDLFNDLTGEIYGRGPLKFIPVLREVHRIEFDPENRGVPLDLNVPPGDPRLQWTKDAEDPKKGIPPRATTFVDFVILLMRDGRDPEPIVLSIKTTNKFQTLAANRLSTFIKFQNGPIYAAYKTVESKSEKNESGTFGVYVINNAGWVQEEQLFKYAEGFHASLKGKTIIVEREPGDESDVEFPTEEATASAAPQM